MKDIADLLGRMVLGVFFLYHAFDAIILFHQNIETMTHYGINWNNNLLLIGMIILLFIGSASVLLGYGASIGAAFLLLYWLPYTLLVFSFWNDPIEIKQETSMNFLNNMAICAGLLFLVANGAGRYSIKRLIYVLRLPS